MGIPDAPWIGLCREDWEERCTLYDEECDDHLLDEADRRWKEEQEEEIRCAIQTGL